MAYTCYVKTFTPYGAPVDTGTHSLSCLVLLLCGNDDVRLKNKKTILKVGGHDQDFEKSGEITALNNTVCLTV